MNYNPINDDTTVEDVVARLKLAGFTVRFASKTDSEAFGYLRWHAVDDNGGYGGEPWVDLGSIASGTDSFGQTSTWARANYTALHRDYPDTFTDISYANCFSLGAFVTDLIGSGDDTTDIVDVLEGLATDYPIYDEQDLYELESEEVTESWSYLVDDIPRWTLKDDSDKEAWVALIDNGRENEVREAFWDAISANDYYPEHNGLEVVWDDREVLQAARAVLSALTDTEVAQ